MSAELILALNAITGMVIAALTLLVVIIYGFQLRSMNRQILELQRSKISGIHIDLARQAEVTNEFFWQHKVRFAVLADKSMQPEIREETSKEIIALHYQLHLLQTAFRGLSIDDKLNWSGYESWFKSIVYPWICQNPELLPFFTDQILTGRDLFTREFLDWLNKTVEAMKLEEFKGE